jgi:ribosome biogenesis GTPase
MTGSPQQGTVLCARSGFADVETPEGVVRCRLRGRLKRTRKRSDLCVVGDAVRISVQHDGSGVVEEVLPRRARFSRRHPGPGGKWREDVLIANPDQLVCVFCFGEPVFNPRMLDRFLVIAEHNDIEAVIVANKVDVASEDARAAFERYAEIGYPLLHTSAEQGQGIDGLAEQLRGRLSAFAGPSGTGKSHLLNAVHPELELPVGHVSDAVGKGRHTTRVASLHPLPRGGYVADTPGIRELGTWRIPSESLAQGFVEFRPFAQQCPFGDCRHVREPGCAVRAASERGDIAPERYDSYLRILLEEERDGAAR